MINFSEKHCVIDSSNCDNVEWKNVEVLPIGLMILIYSDYFWLNMIYSVDGSFVRNEWYENQRITLTLAQIKFTEVIITLLDKWRLSQHYGDIKKSCFANAHVTSTLNIIILSILLSALHHIQIYCCKILFLRVKE